MAKRILVADDERAIVNLAKRALEIKGYQIDFAYNGKDALDIAKSKYQNNESIDLLISDTDMPVMNGHELIKEIKNLDNKIKIMQMSGYGGNVKSEHADAFLKKPFEIDKFYESVEKLLLSE